MLCMNTTTPHAGSDSTGLEHRRVLVVDDNLDSADTLAVLVGLLGAEVHVARDGPGALAETASFHPDAVLLDIGMPGMNGYEVARRIRAMPGHEAIKLIALTGWGEEEDRRLARDSGFDHHLVKPVDVDVLNTLLSRL
jgi:CheY-like chemotaxis protein